MGFVLAVRPGDLKQWNAPADDMTGREDRDESFGLMRRDDGNQTD